MDPVTSAHPLDNLPDHVWWAWHCLPRDKRGRPPSWRSLEHIYQLSPATFSKLCSGERKSVDSPTLIKLAEALRVTPTWLERGGYDDAPQLTGPIEPRPERYAEFDPATWTQRAQQLVANEPSNFDVAVRWVGALETLHPEVITKLRTEAAGKENDIPPQHWGKRLSEAEHAYRREHRAGAPKKRRPKRRREESKATPRTQRKVGT